MRVVQINTHCGSGSTGRICLSISQLLSQKGIENYIYYTVGKSDYPMGIRYMMLLEEKIAALKARVFGNFGFNAYAATKRLIKQLDQIAPDLVHLHNLHGNNVHLNVLFKYFKERNTKIIWTFHDCWAFTGYCPHYDMIGCEQWKSGGCHDCPQKNKTSWFFDKSRWLYEKKKELFTGLDMTIITPSKWLAGQVKQSFLSEYEVKVINNGIDLSVFIPRKSNFRERYHLENKFIILGVSYIWCKQKGFDVFIELSKRLDERFQIVLVGTNDDIDKRLPDNIISIHRTQNQIELAEIYTAADVFINPTRQENFPTTHMESLACGTPVIAFDTGGCSEMLDPTCGCVVEKNNINALEKSIIEVCTQKLYSSDNCIAKSASFAACDRFQEYIDLYI